MVKRQVKEGNLSKTEKTFPGGLACIGELLYDRIHISERKLPEFEAEAAERDVKETVL